MDLWVLIAASFSVPIVAFYSTLLSSLTQVFLSAFSARRHGSQHSLRHERRVSRGWLDFPILVHVLECGWHLHVLGGRGALSFRVCCRSSRSSGGLQVSFFARFKSTRGSDYPCPCSLGCQYKEHPWEHCQHLCRSREAVLKEFKDTRTFVGCT